jgi:hypothetical protein
MDSFSISNPGSSAIPVTAQGYPITVGAGGAGNFPSPSPTRRKSGSSFNFFNNYISRWWWSSSKSPGAVKMQTTGGSGGGGGQADDVQVEQEILLP